MRIRHPWTWLAAAGVLGLLLLRVVWPGLRANLPDCEVRRLTGLHCPGCGGTRCASELLAGDLPGALAMNPVVVLLALGAAVLLFTAVVREWRGYPAALPQSPSWLAWGAVGLVIAFGLVRNLPWWPFTLLVPH